MVRYTVDCAAGRRLGCDSYCCRLLVRLGPGERDPASAGEEGKRFVDKNPVSGRCIHQDPATGLCAIYAQRPAVCRDYDCNRDAMLTVVLRDGCDSIVETSRQAVGQPVPDPSPIPYIELRD